MANKNTKLVGAELLAKLELVKGLPKKDQASQCGYISVNGCVEYSHFLEAILNVNGSIDKSPENRGKKANYVTTVHANSSIVIGNFYIREIGYKAGDRLEIKLEHGQIKLVRISDSENIEIKKVEKVLCPCD